MDMFANGFNLELFLDMLRRRIWIAIVIFCVVMTAGISFLFFLPNMVMLLGRLMKDSRVPTAEKALFAAAIVYVISPLDFIPDVFPVIGQLDDLGIAVAAVEIFLRLCPAGAKAFHQEAITRHRPYSPMAAVDDVIDAQWRRD